MEKKERILIVGGGFGGVYLLKDLHKMMHSGQKAELRLVGEKNYFLFTPLLHEVASGDLSPESTIEPIRKLLGCCPEAFYLGKAGRISTRDRTVEVDGALLPYDRLVIATGAETNFYNIPGAQDHALPLKSLEDALQIKNHLIQIMEEASRTSDRAVRAGLLRLVVVGGGPTGIELVTEIEELIRKTFPRYYSRELLAEVSVFLIQKGQELVPQFSAPLRAKSLEVLRKKKITVMLESGIREVGTDFVVLENGERLASRTVIWVAGIRPRLPEFDVPPPRSPDGRLIVNEYFELEGQKNIFAIGDAAAFPAPGGTLPALAQVAEKEARALAENLIRILDHKPPRKFTYRHSGSLLSLGHWMAAGEIKGISFAGRFAWLIWRVVYLFKFISLRKKIRVAIEWTINFFSPRDISEF